MNKQDAVRFGKWLQAYDPKFFGYVVGSLPAPGSRLNGLGDTAPMPVIPVSEASSSIWDKIQANAAGLANTVTSLASSYYGYKTQKAVVQAAAKQAEQSAPINAQNAIPAVVPDSVKTLSAITSELALPIAAAAMFAMAFLLVGKKGKK